MTFSSVDWLIKTGNKMHIWCKKKTKWSNGYHTNSLTCWNAVVCYSLTKGHTQRFFFVSSLSYLHGNDAIALVPGNRIGLSTDHTRFGMFVSLDRYIIISIVINQQTWRKTDEVFRISSWLIRHLIPFYSRSGNYKKFFFSSLSNNDEMGNVSSSICLASTKESERESSSLPR